MSVEDWASGDLPVRLSACGHVIISTTDHDEDNGCDVCQRADLERERQQFVYDFVPQPRLSWAGAECTESTDLLETASRVRDLFNHVLWRAHATLLHPQQPVATMQVNSRPGVPLKFMEWPWHALLPPMHWVKLLSCLAWQSSRATLTSDLHELPHS